MQTYIALLRGINVSGKKKIKMHRLKELMIDLGFVDVHTYIQSGNLVFKYQTAKTKTIAEIIKKGIAEEFGFEVEVLVLDPKELNSIIQKNPYPVKEDRDKKLIYYVFLIDPPDSEAADKMNSLTYEGEKFTITNECIYLYCYAGYGKARCNNNFFEKKLNVRATTRNYNTVKTLLELSA